MIFASGDPYTRMVTLLKVILPLIALGLLSTMFLFSSRIEPGSTIPFAEGEITERVRDQQVTAPFFTGVTGGGDQVFFTAEEIGAVGEKSSTARELSGQLQFATGGDVVLVSDTGQFDLSGDEATLEGNVLIESSTQYRMRTDRLFARLSELDVHSPGEVRATGPAGDLTAGNMRISAEGPNKSVQLLFSGGVKLIYDPKESR